MLPSRSILYHNILFREFDKIWPLKCPKHKSVELPTGSRIRRRFERFWRVPSTANLHSYLDNNRIISLLPI